MKVLGIETSCDETAVAVVEDAPPCGRILSHLVLSQLKEHEVFGGVVPEIAARAHLEYLDGMVDSAIREAGLAFGDLDAVAATCGPGLIGGVMVGMMAGKAIASACGIPFIAVNHLEAHALTPRLTAPVVFPYLLLLVSGGHTQILAVEGVGRYVRLGTTLDDAAGECFDKAAKLMGLPYPGAPNLEKTAALCGDPARARARFPLPRPLAGKPEPDFSFSGLKTAVRTAVDRLPEGKLQLSDVADLCFSFQDAVADVLADRMTRGIKLFRQRYSATEPVLVVSGGVAVNKTIRARLERLAADNGMIFQAPPLALCSDNGAMIAWAGVERLRLGLTDPLTVAARPRWPLDEMERAS